MFCGYNSTTKFYIDRQNYYQNTMVSYHPVTRIYCQSYVLYHLELSRPRSSRTIEPPQTIAFVNDLEQRINLFCIQGPMQATALDEDVHGVWIYSPQSQNKSWIPDATRNKHSVCQKQIEETLSILTFGSFVFLQFNSVLIRNILS